MARTELAARRPWRWERVRAGVFAVPVWGWLGVVVAVSTVARFLLAREVAAPFIFQDELLYSELAKSLGVTGHFALRDVPGLYGIGPVYPALISPAYALFDSIPTAYAAVKAINALLMSLAAVPAFLIARRLVGPWLALLAAALALAVPDVLLAGTIMTENAFYPLFMLWIYLVVRMLERPTILNQLGVLALLVVLYETRSQALALGPALVTALVLMIAAETWAAGNRGSALVERTRSYWLTWVLIVVGAALYVVVEVVIRGLTLKGSLLKTYTALGTVNYTFGGVAKWFLYHLGELDIITGVLPLAAFVVVLVAACRRDVGTPALRAFAATALAASFWILLVVAAFASSPYSQRLVERNDFYVMPLLLIALVVWVGRFAGTMPRAAGAGAAVAAAVTGLFPATSFFNGNAVTDAFGLLALWGQQIHRGIPPEWVTPIIVVAAMAVAVAFLALPARFALAAPLLVLLFLAVLNRQANFFLTSSGTASRNGGVQVAENWVDRAVGDAKVTFLFTNARPPQALWQNEFFNKTIGQVYNFAGPVDGLPQATAAVDPTTGVLQSGGAPVRAQYVLSDSSVLLTAKQVANDPNVGMSLYRVDGPVRAAGTTGGLYPDTWSGPVATFTGYACHGGRLSMRLTSDTAIHPHPQRIVARSGGRVVARVIVRPGQVHVPFSFPVISRGGACSATVTVTPTAVPAQVTGAPDTRALGIRMQQIAFRPR